MNSGEVIAIVVVIAALTILIYKLWPKRKTDPSACAGSDCTGCPSCLRNPQFHEGATQEETCPQSGNPPKP